MNYLIKKYKELKGKLFGKFQKGDYVLVDFYPHHGKVVLKIEKKLSKKGYHGSVVGRMSDKYKWLYKEGDILWFNSDEKPEACLYVPKTQKEKTIEKIHHLEMKWKATQKEKKK